jgi:hypothetical protein
MVQQTALPTKRLNPPQRLRRVFYIALLNLPVDWNVGMLYKLGYLVFRPSRQKSADIRDLPSVCISYIKKRPNQLVLEQED